MTKKTICLLTILILLSACTETGGPPPPAVPLNAPNDLQSTAAWESYHRAAQATQTFAAQEAAAIARALQGTDTAAAATTAAQATQGSQLATATAQAFEATSTYQSNIATATAAAAQATSTYTAQITTATAVSQETANAVSSISTAQAGAATATGQAAQAEQAMMQLERERRLQPLKTYGPWLIGLALMLLLAGLGGWALVTAVRVWDARKRVIPHGPFGRPLVLLHGPNGRRTILDPSRLFGPAVTVDGESVIMPQLTTPDYQNQTTARSQAVELRQAGHSPHPILMPPPRPQRNTTAANSQSPTAIPAPTLNPALELPSDIPWSLLEERWQGTGLPLGMGANGLLIADPEAYPHLLMAGTSGSGKTRYGLRPLITSALSSGWQVAILDRSGLDFLPFDGHPNAHTVLLSEAEEVIHHLALLYETIQGRLALLLAARTSTWSRLQPAALPRSNPSTSNRPSAGSSIADASAADSSAADSPAAGAAAAIAAAVELSASNPGPRILTVIDEFANLADALPNSEREELWRYARMVAAEGRKAGVHLALALQDPTHKSLDLRIRRNCLPISFRVKDGDASRVILGSGGAERLPPRQFLTVMDRLIQGVAFAPSDEEIRAFLAARPVAPYPAPDWLEGETAAPQPTRVMDPNEQEIADMLIAGRSLREIQHQVFGYAGGAAYEAVKRVQARLVRAD
jgi:hypothetical protein